MSTRLGVCGWPVAHSLSPAMHNAALAAMGLRDWRYQRLPIPPDAFEDTARALHAAGFAGVNVTIPHKEAALAVADRATQTAAAVGAANTLTFDDDGTIHADNTDVTALREILGDLAGRHVLVLGAGGAGRAAVHAALQAGGEVELWNRTAARAERVAAELGATAVTTPTRFADIVVQTTAVGLDRRTDPFKCLPVAADQLREGTAVVDMVYTPGGTPFTRTARQSGATVTDGLEVLVRQGAASLRHWTGRDVPTDVMREAVAQR